MTRSDFDYHAEVLARPRIERRCMHWAVQRVDEILADMDCLPGMTHADAAARLLDLGVSRERVRQLLAGDRRAAARQA